jgi:large subunit ribosomal protein L14e
MFEIGRLIIKIAGRDAGTVGVVINKIDDNTVLIDGNMRRKKCNIKHLEPLKDILEIKKDASTADVHKLMSAAGVKVVERKKVKRSAKKETSKKTVKKTTKKKAVKKE